MACAAVYKVTAHKKGILELSYEPKQKGPDSYIIITKINNSNKINRKKRIFFLGEKTKKRIL